MTVHKFCNMEDGQRCVIEVNAGNLPQALLYADRRKGAILVLVIILALMCPNAVQSGHHPRASQRQSIVPFVPKQPVE